MMPADWNAFGYNGRRSPAKESHCMLDGRKAVVGVVDIVVDIELPVLEPKICVGIGAVAGSQHSVGKEHLTDAAQSVGLLLLARSAYIQWFAEMGTQ